MADLTPAEALRASLARARLDSDISHQAALVKRIKKVLHGKASRARNANLERIVFETGVELQETGFLSAASQSCFSFLVERAPSKRGSSKTSSNYVVQAHYHKAKCDLQKALDIDPFFKDTHTFKSVCQSFDLVCRGIELVLRRSDTERQESYWLIHNGTVQIVEIAEPMLEQGFAATTIKPLCLAVLASESTILLRPASFLAWRTRLYLLLAHAVSLQENNNVGNEQTPTKALHAALAVISKLEEQVQLLEDIENEEPPLVSDTILAISNARTEAWIARQKYSLLLGKTTCEEQADAVDAATNNKQDVDYKEPMSSSLNEGKAEVKSVFSAETGAKLSDIILFETWVQCLSLSRRRDYPSIDQHDIICALIKRSKSDTSTCSWPVLVQACEHVVWLRDWSVFQDVHDLLLASLSLVRASFMETEIEALERHVQMMYLLYMLESGKPGSSRGPQDRRQSIELARVEGREINVSFLSRLGHLLVSCANQAQRSVSIKRANFVAHVALRVWHPYCTAMIESIAAMEAYGGLAPGRLLDMTLQVIDSVYAALEAVAADDVLVMVRICARRAFILRVGYRDYVGARQTLKQGIGMIHDGVDRIVCRGANEVAGVYTNTKESHYSLSCLPRLVGASADDSTNCGERFESAVEDMLVMEVEMTTMLAQVELEDAMAKDLLRTGNLTTDGLIGTGDARIPQGDIATENTNTNNTNAADILGLQSPTVCALQKQCGRNMYQLGLMYCAVATACSNVPVRTAALREAETAFRKAAQREKKLVGEWTKNMSYVTTTRDGVSDEACVVGADEALPRPVPVARSPYSVVLAVPALEIIPETNKLGVAQPTDENNNNSQVAFLILYGKEAKSGMVVSESNCELPGTGIPIPVTNSNQHKPTLLTASGLTKGRAYVFAVAALNIKGRVIRAVGKPSLPVDTLSTLPLVNCWATLCSATHRIARETRLFSPDKAVPEALEWRAIEEGAYEKLFSHFVDRNISAVESRSFSEPLRFFAVRQTAVDAAPRALVQSFMQATLAHVQAQDPPRARVDFGLSGDPLTEPMTSLVERQLSILKQAECLEIVVELACSLDDTDAIIESATSLFEFMGPMLQSDTANAIIFGPLLRLHHILSLLHDDVLTTNIRSLFSRISFEICRVSEFLKEKDVAGKVLLGNLSDNFHKNDHKLDETEAGSVDQDNATSTMPVTVWAVFGDNVSSQQRAFAMMLSKEATFAKLGLRTIADCAKVEPSVANSKNQEIRDEIVRTENTGVVDEPGGNEKEQGNKEDEQHGLSKDNSSAVIDSDHVGGGEETKTSLDKDDLWFGVHSSLLAHEFEKAWQLCTGVNSEKHPMFLYLLNLVCKVSLENGHPASEHWCEDVQQLFIDLKCPPLLHDSLEQQSDKLSTGTRRHFETCFQLSETPITVNLNSSESVIPGTHKAENDKTKTTAEVIGIQDPESESGQPSQVLEEKVFLLPLVNAVIGLELLEHLDPITSDIARASFPSSGRQQNLFAVDEAAVERVTALAAVCDELIPEEASQLCALAEFELVRAEYMLRKCQQVFASYSMWLRGAWGKGPMLQSKLFLLSVLHHGGNGMHETGAGGGGGGAHRRGSRGSHHTQFTQHTQSSFKHAQGDENTLLRPKINLPKLSLLGPDRKTPQELPIELQHQIPQLIHVSSRAMVRARYGGHWHQLQKAGKIVWNAILLGWLGPDAFGENSVCFAVLDLHLRAKMDPENEQDAVHDALLEQERGGANQQKAKEMSSSTSPKTLNSPKEGESGEGAKGATHEGLKKYDWRPLWRGVLAALDLIERMGKLDAQDAQEMEEAKTEEIETDEQQQLQEDQEEDDHGSALSLPGDNSVAASINDENHDTQSHFGDEATVSINGMNNGFMSGSENSIHILALQGVELQWLFNLVRFLLQVLAKLERWRELVWLGKRFISAVTGQVDYTSDILRMVCHGKRVLHAHASLETEEERHTLQLYLSDYEEAQRRKKKRSRKKTATSTSQLVDPLVLEEARLHTVRTAELQQAIDVCIARETDWLGRLEDSETYLKQLERDTSSAVVAVDAARLLVENAMIKAVRQVNCNHNKNSLGANLQSARTLKSHKSHRSHKSANTRRGTTVGPGPHGIHVAGALGTYTRTTAMLRQKGERGLFAQTVCELGDQHYARATRVDLVQANKCWRDAVDVLLCHVDSVDDWSAAISANSSANRPTGRDMKSPLPLDGTSPGQSIMKSCGLYGCLIGAVACSKIARFELRGSFTKHDECLILGAHFVLGALAGSVQVPTRLHEFASFSTNQLWPDLDVFADQRRMPPRVLISALEYLARGLADSLDGMVNLMALPIVSTLHHLLRYRILGFAQTVDTFIIQAQVLGKVGRLSSASEVLRDIVLGDNKLGPLLHASTRECASTTTEDKENGKDNKEDNINAIDSQESQGTLEILDDKLRFWEGMNPQALSWLVSLDSHTVDDRVNDALKSSTQIRIALQRLTLAIEVLEAGGQSPDEGSQEVRTSTAKQCAAWASALCELANGKESVGLNTNRSDQSKPKRKASTKSAADTSMTETETPGQQVERMALWQQLGCKEGNVDAWLVTFASELHARALVQLGANDDALKVLLTKLEGPAELCRTRIQEEQDDGEPAKLQNKDSNAKHAEAPGAAAADLDMKLVRQIIYGRMQLVRAMQRGRHLENALDQARLGRDNCDSIGETKMQIIFLSLEAQVLLELGQLHESESVLRRALGLPKSPDMNSNVSALVTTNKNNSSINVDNVFLSNNPVLLGRRWHAQAMVQCARQVLAPRGELEGAVQMLTTAAQFFESDLKALGATTIICETESNSYDTTPPSGRHQPLLQELAEAKVFLVMYRRKNMAHIETESELQTDLCHLNDARNALEMSVEWNPVLTCRQLFLRGNVLRLLGQPFERCFGAYGEALKIALKNVSFDFDVIHALLIELFITCAESTEGGAKMAWTFLKNAVRVIHSRKQFLTQNGSLGRGESNGSIDVLDSVSSVICTRVCEVRKRCDAVAAKCVDLADIGGVLATPETQPGSRVIMDLLLMELHQLSNCTSVAHCSDRVLELISMFRTISGSFGTGNSDMPSSEDAITDWPTWQNKIAQEQETNEQPSNSYMAVQYHGFSARSPGMVTLVALVGGDKCRWVTRQVQWEVLEEARKALVSVIRQGTETASNNGSIECEKLWTECLGAIAHLLGAQSEELIADASAKLMGEQKCLDEKSGKVLLDLIDVSCGFGGDIKEHPLLLEWLTLVLMENE